MCPQTSLEPALKCHVQDCGNVFVLWGWEVVHIEQDANEATLTLTSEEGEKKKFVKNNYAIACDGGRSPICKQLNVHTLL